MEARIDITDLYAFQKPEDRTKTILVLNVNPLAPTLATSFDPDAIYEIKIDTDADAVAEIAFRITFTPPGPNGQRASVAMVTGDAAAPAGAGGEAIVEDVPVSFGADAAVTTAGFYQFFAGIRSDPFFFDLMGFLNGLKFTGSDFFIDKNVFGIVLEVPNFALGSNPKIGVWARTMLPVAGTPFGFTQADRMGRPAINTVFNHGEDKNTFNHIEPTRDRALFLNSFVSTLQSFKYSTAQATQIAQILLPDILTYDYTSSAGFLNGRKLIDDVIDISLNLVTNGAVTTDMVGPHNDLLTSFPYLGPPHPVTK
jgi:hypothetical protein